MDSPEELFEKKRIQCINNFIEEKGEILKEVKDFKEKDGKLSQLMSDFENDLNKNQKENFNEIIRLMYQLEEYYFALAYLLGNKYGQELNNEL